MKYIFISILLLTEISYSQEKQFKNQGELEDHQAQEFFKKEYSQQNFAKFSGSIEIIDNITIKFDYKTLIIWNVDAKLLDIFSEGIFYPQILLGNDGNTVYKKQSKIDQLSDGERLNYYISKNDSLKISNFKELGFLSTSPKVKRFGLWIYWPGFANPQAYFIELTSDQATEKTDLKTFIKNARLTFVKGAWIVI